MRIAAAFALAAGLATGAEAAPARCEPLPAPAGSAITLGPAQAAELPAIVQKAAPGTTILLRDGTYRLRGSGLLVRAAGVTIRSVSGEAAKVVIDGAYQTNELIAIAASNVTVAHVTLTHAVDHLVHLYPLRNETVRGAKLYGLRLLDSGEQFVKANSNRTRSAYVDDVTVECSEFQLTDAGRPRVESLGGTSCYTGGIDVHAGRGWVVRLNQFRDVYCRTGFLAEHAVHFWSGSRDTLVENNLIVNCARGIGFGLGPTGQAYRVWDDLDPAVGYVGHLGGLIRNNVIVATVSQYDTGIGLEQARDARVFHNTVFASGGATKAFSAIDARFRNTRAEIRNNLVNNLTTRGGATVIASHNLERITAAMFVNADGLDFHLRPGAAAVDRGMVVPDAGLDLDGHPRGDRPDIGADERNVSSLSSRSSSQPPRCCDRIAGHTRHPWT